MLLMTYSSSEKRLSFAFPLPKPLFLRSSLLAKRTGRQGWPAQMNLLDNSPAWSTALASAFLNIWQDHALNMKQKCDLRWEGKCATKWTSSSETMENKRACTTAHFWWNPSGGSL